MGVSRVVYASASAEVARDGVRCRGIRRMWLVMAFDVVEYGARVHHARRARARARARRRVVASWASPRPRWRAIVRRSARARARRGYGCAPSRCARIERAIASCPLDPVRRRVTDGSTRARADHGGARARVGTGATRSRGCGRGRGRVDERKRAREHGRDDAGRRDAAGAVRAVGFARAARRGRCARAEGG